MINKENNSSVLIVLLPLLLVALLFEIIHLPGVIADNRPDLITLIIIYFSMNGKLKMSLEVSWFVGIILDLITGSPLGVHAFSIILQVYIISSQFVFAKYKIYQQILIVGIVNLFANSIGYWLEHIIGQSYYEVNFLLPAVVTAAVWPLVVVLCQILCSTFSVATSDKDNND